MQATSPPAADSQKPVVIVRLVLAGAAVVAGGGERRAAELPLVAVRLQSDDGEDIHVRGRERIESPWIGAAITRACRLVCCESLPVRQGGWAL
jgi:hypothetical protein